MPISSLDDTNCGPSQTVSDCSSTTSELKASERASKNSTSTSSRRTMAKASSILSTKATKRTSSTSTMTSTESPSPFPSTTATEKSPSSLVTTTTKGYSRTPASLTIRHGGNATKESPPMDPLDVITVLISVCAPFITVFLAVCVWAAFKRWKKRKAAQEESRAVQLEDFSGRSGPSVV
ncbi:hypothetical protein ONS95_011733 [Cadophora gregata]|uniref:uncharacterized protein n=1 Tax=Cadophora gregata TaxID=51156 RepID=UPI0026DBB681|nr:uncharacterized protein ONS95_011733 [Cadophora gregata]KAK0120327.1 hypothetical protein ONS95_011733 [Cadophora gregata]